MKPLYFTKYNHISLTFQAFENPPVINLQPTSGSTIYAFDPVSETVLQGFPRVHKSHRNLKETVDENLAVISQTCQSNRMSLTSGLSYDQFLAGNLDRREFLIISIE